MHTTGYRIIAISARTPQPRNKHVYAATTSGYRRALTAARREGKDYTVESVCGCSQPGQNDANGWDEYRLRHGYSGLR